MRLLNKFACDEQGMETVEWAILAALIVAGLVAVITTLGSNVLAKFTTLKKRDHLSVVVQSVFLHVRRRRHLS